MTHTTPRRRTALAGVIIAAALSFGLAACSSAPTADTASEVTKGAGAKYGECMRDAGFAVEDPSDAELESGMAKGPSGVDEEAFGEAMGTCRKKAGVAGKSDAELQEFARQTAKIASCIRENGYADFPEQKPGVLDGQGYARGQEAGFEKVRKQCSAKYAPDTQNQEVH